MHFIDRLKINVAVTVIEICCTNYQTRTKIEMSIWSEILRSAPKQLIGEGIYYLQPKTDTTKGFLNDLGSVRCLL